MAKLYPFYVVEKLHNCWKTGLNIDLSTDKFAGGKHRHNEVPVTLQQVVFQAVVDVKQVVSVGPRIANKIVRQWSVKYQISPTLIELPYEEYRLR